MSTRGKSPRIGLRISRTVAPIALALLLPTAVAAQPLLTGTVLEINVGVGDQIDPHVDCDLASYTSVEGLQSDIRLFNFGTHADALIPSIGTAFLSGISGTRVVFTQTAGGASNIIVYDTITGASAPIPGGNQRTNSSIGGTLVAFEDRSFSTNPLHSEIVVYDLSTGTLTRLTNDALMDLDPQVSPTGSAVVWTKCQTSGVRCDIYSAVQTAPGMWAAAQLTGLEGEESNPDTDGIIVVYASTRVADTDIYFRPLGSAVETQLAMPGEQRNSSISGDLITFESETAAGDFDIFVFDVSTYTLYRLTQTPVDETLNDISLCNGIARVVYSAPGENGDFDVFAFTFLPPGTTGVPVTLILTPTTAQIPVGTSHTVTATVTDAAGQPVAGISVNVTVEGAVSDTVGCSTDAAGQCTVTYAGPLLPGADLISAFADTDGNGIQNEAEPTATATALWQLPAGTAGHVMGGGQIPNAAGSDEIVFVFQARTTDRGFTGTCRVLDRTADTRVECLDVLALVVTANHVTVFGNATINGVTVTYRIDADDVGEAGAGRDRFTIQTSTGYAAAGVLLRGNVQAK